MTLRFTRQYDAMDCGPACVRMVASAHGKLFPLPWLRSQACLNREGVSVAGIRRALTEVGMESAAFRMTLDELEEKCPLPAILHWNQNHFVVVERVRRRRGRREWRIADLIIVMRGGAVVEAGTHRELAAARGYYYDLIRNQLELANQ